MSKPSIVDALYYAMRECVTPPVIPYAKATVVDCRTCGRYVCEEFDLLRQCRHCRCVERQDLLARQAIVPGGQSCPEDGERGGYGVRRKGRSNPVYSSLNRYHGERSDDV